MPDWTRRDLFRATAAATAAAVPVVALHGTGALARSAPNITQQPDDLEGALQALESAGISSREPVMVYVHDARRGEVSILHGTSEVIVQDRRLVSKIMRAKAGSLGN